MRGRKRFARSFGRTKREYMWVTSQVNESAYAAATTTQVVLVNGADWERGGADARETCSLVRTIIEFRFHAASQVLLYPMDYNLMVQDEDESAIAPNAIASNGDERYLQFGYIPQSPPTYDGANANVVGYRHIETKQRVRLANSDELRFHFRSQSATVTGLYSVMARALLQLSP